MATTYTVRVIHCGTPATEKAALMSFLERALAYKAAQAQAQSAKSEQEQPAA